MVKRKQFPRRDLNPAKIVARAERQDSFHEMMEVALETAWQSV